MAHLTDTTASGNGAGNGLNGYLELSPPSYSTRIYWGFPLSEPNGALGTPIPVFEASGWTSPLLWSNLDTTLGRLPPSSSTVRAIKLPMWPFRSSSLDQASNVPYYNDNGLPTQRAMHTGVMGTGFFINVKPGSVTVSATPVGQTDPAEHHHRTGLSRVLNRNQPSAHAHALSWRIARGRLGGHTGPHAAPERLSRRPGPLHRGALARGHGR